MDEADSKVTTRRRRIPSGAWVAIGVVAAAIIAPATAVAATNLVGIVGGNGARVGVTHADQMLATQTSAGSFVDLYGYAPSICKKLYTVPKGKGLILESATFNTTYDPTPGGGFYAGLFTSPTCSSGHYFLDHNPGSVGEVTVALTPGIALKAGTSIYAEDFTVETEIYLFGYLVPSSDVMGNHLPATLGRAAGVPAQR